MKVRTHYPKSMEHSESSPKREIGSNIGLCQKTRKISDKLSNHTPKRTRKKERNKTQNK